MATTVSLRKLLDRKQWEMCAANNLSALGQAVLAQSTVFDGYQFWLGNSTNTWLYDPREDAFMALPVCPTAMNTPYTGTCYHPSGPTGTASAGSATTISTTLTLPGSLAGYTIRVTGGTGAGQERTIASNTYGANSVLTVSATWTTNPDATSTYLLLTGRFWALNGGGPALRYYDVATNTWSSALTTTGLSTQFNNWCLTATPAYGNTIATGTATAGAASTLTNSGKSWATNQWTNYQVRLTGGTGAGQVRTIASNTATVLTVSSTWSTNPDATSTYVIEPNDDYLYAAAAGVSTLYRYSIAGNSWSTLSPGTARTAVLGVLGCLEWVAVASDASWADETSIKNGRYLYSFQGGGSANLSYYDIAANTWVNLTTTYGRGGGGGDGFTAAYNNGWTFATDREFIYILNPATTSATATCWRYNCVTQTLDAWASMTVPVSNLGYNKRSSVVSYTDGGTTLRWVYWAPGYGPVTIFRMLII